jgi:hypothetical protein
LVEDAGESSAAFDDGEDVLDGEDWRHKLHGRAERGFGLLLLGGRVVEPGEHLPPCRFRAGVAKSSSAPLHLAARGGDALACRDDLFTAVGTMGHCRNDLLRCLGCPVGSEELVEPFLEGGDDRLLRDEHVARGASAMPG